MVRGCAVLACFLLLSASAESGFHNIADVRRSLLSTNAFGHTFALSACVTDIRRTLTPSGAYGLADLLVLEDDSGACVFSCPYPSKEIASLACGDRLAIRGYLRPDSPFAVLSSLKLISHGLPPHPVAITPREMERTTTDFKRATITGFVRDAFPSDSNRDWTVMKLADGDVFVDVSVLTRPCDQARLHALIGATVSITGIIAPFDNSHRKQMGRILWCWSPDNIVTRIPPPADPYATADISVLSGLTPSAITRKGRHKAIGRVLAVWGNDQLLLENVTEGVSRVNLAKASLPGIGEMIEVIGYPESDLYHINLLRAEWRACPTNRVTNRLASQTTPRPFNDIFLDTTMPGCINIRAHGQTVRLVGRICGIPSVGPEVGLIYVDNAQQIVSVDISANPQIVSDLSLGCEVELAGVCVIDTPNWTPNALCQKADRFFLVARSPSDVKVLSRPSWWTPGRSLLVASTLLLVLIAIAVWNRALIVVSGRKSRALLREQIGHIRAKLKIDERTRLAVDLHDALSQNLTGISLQLDLVGRLMTDADENVARHLDIAARTLQSCRNELRGCIWDLRNQALDEPSLESAIRMTLRPHLDAARLILRFPVPRRRLDDNTTHALLRIIRELVTNALRHGAAKFIRIAGALEGNLLRASIQDDGSGFDPATRPNSCNGHFGLDGIRERLRLLDGTLAIESSPEKGTKVTVSLHLPSENKEYG